MTLFPSKRQQSQTNEHDGGHFNSYFAFLCMDAFTTIACAKCEMSERLWDCDVARYMYMTYIYSVSQKNNPLRLSYIFPKRLGIFSPNFTRLLYASIYARLPIFIRLSATLAKLCHIKLDHPVQIGETHAFKHVRKSLIHVVWWSLSVASHPRSADVHF